MFTIVVEDSQGLVSCKMVYEHLEWRQEKGIDLQGPEPKANGQQRLTLRAWSGCASYDEFTTDGRPVTGECLPR
jgi:hypothetical protein